MPTKGGNVIELLPINLQETVKCMTECVVEPNNTIIQGKEEPVTERDDLARSLAPLVAEESEMMNAVLDTICKLQKLFD
jgi:hypothetical protein